MDDSAIEKELGFFLGEALNLKLNIDKCNQDIQRATAAKQQYEDQLERLKRTKVRLVQKT